MGHVAVVTDSTACLPDELVQAHGIAVVALHVVADGVERDEAELLALPDDELVAWLGGLKKVGTSRPSPAALLAAYEDAARAGATSVVSVHLSGHLSGTVDAAILAASRSSIPVEVVDSAQAGMAQGFAVLSAAERAAAGGSSTEVAAAARARAAAAVTTFYVDSLEPLRRGGRIGAAAALLGTTLAIKPILTIEDGVVRPVAKVRTAARAVDRLVADAAAVAADSPHGADIAVHSLGAESRGGQILSRLADSCPEASIAGYRLGPVLGAHVGPGTVAVVVAPRL